MLNRGLSVAKPTMIIAEEKTTFVQLKHGKFDAVLLLNGVARQPGVPNRSSGNVNVVCL